MANTEDDADSRTALINAPRSRSYPNSARDSGDNEDRPAKRRRRNRSRANSDVTDFVPRGGAFSADTLAVDPDETSSSGSSSSDESDSDAEMGKRQVVANPHAGSAPVINWNSGRKAAVRTTLGKRKTPAGRQSGPKEPQEKERPDKKAKQDESQFKDVNTFWRAGSASASDEASDIVNGKEDSDSRSEGEVSDDESINIESDSSGSLDSEEDDSMLLNIGTKDGAGSDDYDPAEMEVGNGTVNGANGQTPETASSATSNPRRSQSKEAAFQQFAKKYPTAPVTLADLDEEELQIQVQYIYWDRDSDGIDMQLPVGCTECLQHGHLTDVCPARECDHCGAWNQHPNYRCPTWLRCQRCREKGHDEKDCTSKLKGSVTEVPCDLCGWPHLESQCESIWTFPTRALIPAPTEIHVSISCAHCLSQAHLIGDCPNLKPFQTSLTLKGIDPSIKIVDLNKAPRKRPEPIDYSRDGNPHRPKAQTLSSSEDNLPRKGRQPPAARGARGARGGGRGTIRFGDSFTVRNGSGPDNSRSSGRGKGKPPPFAPSASRPPPPSRGGGRGKGRGKPGRRGK